MTRSDYGDGELYLYVTANFDGGATITSYTATCTDGTNTYTGTGTSSPITVSGLTNDVAYTCTVTATNSVGTSSASAATDPITPEEMSTGLPIWLLYQATYSVSRLLKGNGRAIVTLRLSQQGGFVQTGRWLEFPICAAPFFWYAKIADELGMTFSAMRPISDIKHCAFKNTPCYYLASLTLK